MALTVKPVQNPILTRVKSPVSAPLQTALPIYRMPNSGNGSSSPQFAPPTGVQDFQYQDQPSVYQGGQFNPGLVPLQTGGSFTNTAQPARQPFNASLAQSPPPYSTVPYNITGLNGSGLFNTDTGLNELPDFRVPRSNLNAPSFQTYKKLGIR